MSEKLMWVEKYRPQTMAEVIGNEEAKINFLKWLRAWKPGGKAFFMFGPPGVGKTSLVHAAAKEFRYDLVEMNASDTRTDELIMKIAGHAASDSSMTRFLFGSAGTMVLLDEVDGIHGRADQGGLSAILRILETSKVPIVLTANDASDPRLRDLRENAIWQRFYEIRPPILTAFLEHICKNESIKTEKTVLETVVIRSKGDVRSAINDLQTLAEVDGAVSTSQNKQVFSRDRELNVQTTVKNILLAESPELAKIAQIESQVEYENLFLAISDNVPLQYKDPDEVGEAFDHLSRADVFFGRINRTRDYGLLGYALEEMSMGVANARQHAYQPVGYQYPPSRFIALSRSRSEREMLNSIAAGLGPELHASRRDVIKEIIPFLRIILREDMKNGNHIAMALRLTDEQVTFLTGIRMQTPKLTKKISKKGLTKKKK